jgi:hypothetical protein
LIAGGVGRQSLKQLLVRAILLVSLSATLSGFPQSTGIARVCVSASYTNFGRRGAYQVNSTPQVRTQRDMVVKYLNNPSTKGQVTLEAVALTTVDSDAIPREVSELGCNFLVTLTFDPQWFETPAIANVPEGPEGQVGFNRSAPLVFVLLRRKSPHLWVSPEQGTYSQYQFSAKGVAAEVRKTMLKSLKNKVP